MGKFYVVWMPISKNTVMNAMLILLPTIMIKLGGTQDGEGGLLSLLLEWRLVKDFWRFWKPNWWNWIGVNEYNTLFFFFNQKGFTPGRIFFLSFFLFSFNLQAGKQGYFLALGAAPGHVDALPSVSLTSFIPGLDGSPRAEPTQGQLGEASVPEGSSLDRRDRDGKGVRKHWC